MVAHNPCANSDVVRLRRPRAQNLQQVHGAPEQSLYDLILGQIVAPDVVARHAFVPAFVAGPANIDCRAGKATARTRPRNAVRTASSDSMANGGNLIDRERRCTVEGMGHESVPVFLDFGLHFDIDRDYACAGSVA